MEIIHQLPYRGGVPVNLVRGALGSIANVVHELVHFDPADNAEISDPPHVGLDEVMDAIRQRRIS